MLASFHKATQLQSLTTFVCVCEDNVYSRKFAGLNSGSMDSTRHNYQVRTEAITETDLHSES